MKAMWAEAAQGILDAVLEEDFLREQEMRSLPLPLRLVSYVLPATHFIRISRGIIIRGASFGDIWQSVAN